MKRHVAPNCSDRSRRRRIGPGIRGRTSSCLAAALVALVSARAAAQDPATPAPEPQHGALQEAIEDLLATTWSRVRLHGHLQAGFTLNPSHPSDHLNFGRLFDDRSNDFRLNELALTLEQPFSADPSAFDFAFKVQITLGSNARFTHATGILDNTLSGSIQPEILESWAAVHFPIVTEGGFDLKAGTFATLCGYESMDPESNPLYSHGYIFNFGVPFKHTGVLATFHAMPWLDVCGGIVTGINTGWSDNNDALAFHGGVVVRAIEGDGLTFALGVHHGPETPERTAPPGIHAHDDARTIFDLVITANPWPELTLVTDLNHGHDDARLGIGGTRPDWYGVAQYLTYHASPKIDITLRGEIFRDDDGFVVAQFASDDDYADIQAGRPTTLDPRTFGGGATTYEALTLGATWHATSTLQVQGEVRYDHTRGGAPFDGGTSHHQFTAGLAVLWNF